MGYATAMRCRECGAEYPLSRRTACEACFASLKIVYDYERVKEQLTPAALAKRPKTLWRYMELLPLEAPERVVDLAPGYTPMRRAENLGRHLGIRELYLKDDTVNPTYSFKDRPTAVAVSKAVEWGLSAVGCASTGNLAGATAAAAAKARLPCYIFIPASLDETKVFSALAYGAKVIGVHGTYDDANRIANLVADRYNWGLVNINIRPFYLEGSKTLGFETCEQLGWTAPDRVLIPMGSGALLTAVQKSFEELLTLGLIGSLSTRICGSQPRGCAPIVNAFERGETRIEPVEAPDTIAESLAIGDPASGSEAVEIMQKTGGFADAPLDGEIVEAQRLLARTEGILAEPAGGTVIATLKRRLEDGTIGPDERVVCYVTGNGLKAPHTFSGMLGEMITVEASFEEAMRVLEEVV